MMLGHQDVCDCIYLTEKSWGSRASRAPAKIVHAESQDLRASQKLVLKFPISVGAGLGIVVHRQRVPTLPLADIENFNESEVLSDGNTHL
jgi:hypothetical protein